MGLFDKYTKKLGFDCLRERRRDVKTSTARQCVMYCMSKKGYSNTDISKASDRSRSDVIYSIKAFQDLLDVNDKLAVSYYKKLRFI